jgi:hypothetical protein
MITRTENAFRRGRLVVREFTTAILGEATKVDTSIPAGGPYDVEDMPDGYGFGGKSDRRLYSKTVNS